MNLVSELGAPNVGQLCPVLLAMARMEGNVVLVASHIPACSECQNVATVLNRVATSRAGRSTSDAKARAARINGRRGGRPRRAIA